MSTSTTAVTSAKGDTFAQRKARTLIGWLSPQEGALWLAGRQMTAAPDPAHNARCQAARDAVAQRPVGCDQADLFQPLPAELEPHIAALHGHPRSAQVLAEAGEPRLVDIRRVCAAQPTIHVEDAVARVSGVAPADLVALAQLTLPLHIPAPMPFMFDQVRNAWVLSSPNPNLRVAAPFSGEVQPGSFGFGFVAELARSYVQVAGVGGRYFLRDGYHRTHGLLAAGVTWIPALVREYASIEEVAMPMGLLPPATYLGDRPPMLSDYLDATVSAETSAPVTTKIVLVQAIEISSLA